LGKEKTGRKTNRRGRITTSKLEKERSHRGINRRLNRKSDKITTDQSRCNWKIPAFQTDVYFVLIDRASWEKR